MPTVKHECRNPNCPKDDNNPDDGASTKLKVCSRCKQAAYCSVECQKSHWKVHKVECKAVVEDGAKLIQKKNLQPEGCWTYDPNYVSPLEEYQILQEWEASVPKSDLQRGISAKEHMRRLGISAAMVRGLPVGDWQGASARMLKLNRKIRIQNDPKLKIGDYVEIQPGNNVTASVVGLRGHLETYFKKKDKWGIDLENGEPSMIMTGNLKRVSYDTPRESPW